MTDLRVGDVVTHAVWSGAGVVVSMAHEWPNVEIYWDSGVVDIESIEFLEIVSWYDNAC